MFQIKNIIQKKILRLKGSKNILKLNFFFHKYFGEKDIGEIGLNFSNKPDKKKIVQNTISRKKYKSYLEIGCFNNDLDQAIPRCKYIWNGDVWKAIVELRTLDYVDTYTCYADMGIGVILKNKNKKKLKIDIKDFSKLKFSDYFKNFKEYMNIVEYDELGNLF